MHDRRERIIAAICSNRTRWGRPVDIGARALVLVFVATLFVAVGQAMAQNALPPAMEASATDPGAPPMSQSGDVNFFSQDLGTVVRLSYKSESYGQDGTGNLDIGTMQVVTMDDTAAFFDGQVTMNDVDGVGFNLGLGYRWMSFPPYSADTGRMEGVSLWADGTHTEAGNFFPQIGVSYESLGEMWDIRANGYIPVGDKEQVGAFKPTNQVGFSGNSISNLTQAIVDRSFYAGELEIARRLGSERDVWGFAGPYFVANDTDSSAGVRVGVRGYAYPDLLLQFAVSDDDVFKTNATFSVVWFVGRTRTDFQPACGTPDRFREPVMRNDFVVLSHTKRQSGISLTQPDGTALRIVHVDSDAASGGDGTFEHPFDMLTDVNGAGSQKGDIILAHSTSVFTGEPSVLLKDNQRLLGEGNNLIETVATKEKGTITIPESSPGARALAKPKILGATGDAVTLADSNEVANFDIDGQNVTNRAIASPAAGAGNPNLHDLAISNTVGNAIELTPFDFIDTLDVDKDGNTTERIMHGNVTIDKVTLDNVGGNGIDITATAVDVTQPNVQLLEAITLSKITSTDGAGRGIAIRNTHTGAGHTTTLTNYTYDGGATSAGGIQLENFDGTFTASNSTLTNGAAASKGVEILGDSDGKITFANTVAFNNVTGTSVDIDGNVLGVDQLGGTIEFDGAINSDTGRSVSVQNIAAGASVSFLGNITDTGQGILANSNSGGLILFAGDLTMTTTTNKAIELTDNTGAEIDFPGKLDITTTSGDGFVATGGGTLTASATTNTITTDTGQIAKITGMTISTSNVKFSEVNRTTAAASSAIQLEDNTGTGSIDIGTTTNTVGQTGTIAGGAADTIVINDSANVSINGVIVNNAAGFSGVHVEKTTAGTQTTSLSDLAVNNGDSGFEVSGLAGAGALNMTIDDTTINGSTAFGLSFDDVDTGAIKVRNSTLDGNNANAGAVGVRIRNSNATFTFDDTPATQNTVIREWGSTDFEVDGGVPNITFNGAIINASADNILDTTGRSVVVHNATGGSVSFTANSSIKDDNLGMLVENNSGGTFTFLGTHDLETSTADAVTVQNNTGTANVLFDGLDIKTTDGRGVVIAGNASTTSVAITDVDVTTTSTIGMGAAFTATGAGGLTVTGNNNVITTTTGTGLTITGMNIVAGASFESVTVNGAANGIVLTNLTGAQVTVGESGGAQNSGGTLTTTGDAIVVTNAQNVDLLHLQVVSAGGNGATITHDNTATTTMDVNIDGLNLDAAAGTGIAVTADNNNAFALKLRNSDLEENVTMTDSGAGHFSLLVDNNSIDTGNVNSFELFFDNVATNGDVTIRNNNNFTAGDAHALLIDSTGVPTVRLLVEDSHFINTSLQATAEFHGRGNSVSDNTIQGNTFTNNNGAGQDFVMSSFDSATINLNLGGAGADKNTAGDFTLNQNNVSIFNVVDKANTFAGSRNNGTVNTNPLPTSFNNIVAPPPPTLPTVPP